MNEILNKAVKVITELEEIVGKAERLNPEHIKFEATRKKLRDRREDLLVDYCDFVKELKREMRRTNVLIERKFKG